MEMNSVNSNDYAPRVVEEKQQINPQREEQSPQQRVQQEVLQETTVGAQSPQKQMMALLASAQPEKQVQQTAQDQIEKGFLDVRI